MIGVRKRGQEKAERRARPKRDERDQAAEADHQRRRAPARQSLAGKGFGYIAHVAPGNSRFEKVAQHRGSSWMSKMEIARSRIARCMAVPPVLRSLAAPAPSRFAIICCSDYGFH